VLVADDNQALQESLGYMLQGAGCEIRAAPDGMHAVEMANSWRPDVVFVDIHMPGLNGFQVARQLRSQFSRSAMKLVLMSGMSLDESLAQDARKAGFDACIDKVAEPALWLRHLAPAGAAHEGDPL
jgi:CheY-like chemotaxis protein